MNIQKTKARSVTTGLPERTWTIVPQRAGEPSNEFVYFMYSAGRVKIGYSRGVGGRHKSLSASVPFPPTVILVVSGNIGTEHDLHVRFHKDRLHGEWFSLSSDLRDYLKDHLCDIGRDSLDRAEADFKSYCEQFLAEYKPPPRRSRRPPCAHGMPYGKGCYPCERERDLKVLAKLRPETSFQEATR